MALGEAERRELLELFAGEVREQAARVRELLLRPRDKLEAIDAVMRELHSIKGAASSLGLGELAEEAHALESLLVPIRKRGDLAALPAVIDQLLAGVEGLATKARAPGASADGSVRITARALDQALDAADAILTTRYDLERRAAKLRALSESLDAVTHLARSLDRGRASQLTDEIRTLRGRAWTLANDFTESLLHLELRTRELSDQLRTARLIPLKTLFPELEVAARERARVEGKELALVLDDHGVSIDRSVAEELRSALVHIINNAVDHGLETPEVRSARGKPVAGRITLRAESAGSRVMIRVTDDGAGVDRARVLESAVALGLASAAEPESKALDLMFAPSLTTRKQATLGSGRGFGLDAVRAAMKKLGGSVAVVSEPGRGTELGLDLPITIALAQVLLVEVSGLTVALPLAAIERSLRFQATEIALVDGHHALKVMGDVLPIADLGTVLGLPGGRVADSRRAQRGVVLAAGEKKVILLVDRLLGDREVVVKPLPSHAGRPPLVTAATVLGDAQIVPILDWQAVLVAALGLRIASLVVQPGARAARHTILIVDDSITTRATNKSLLELAGYRVIVAADGVEAIDKLASHDVSLIVSDVSMPRMDGFELTTKVRADERLRALPVVLVTSLDSLEDRMRGAAVGATAYLLKRELSRGALVEMVRSLMGTGTR